MADPFIGEIRLFGGTFAPVNWALCNGQPMAISQNAALFQLIGTTYGGDGVTTFALPNLAARVPVHQGGGLTRGQAAGVESVTLTAAQLVAHTHPLNAIGNTPGTLDTPGGNLPAQSLDVTPYINDVAGASFSAQAVTVAGGSQPHDNLQPYLCVNFIIALFGIFPSQS
jgi:microcystin-dependent protein